MTTEDNWLTIHRVRFPDVVDGAGQPFPKPAASDIWRFAPEGLPVASDGHRPCANDSWGGFALYKNKQEAQEVFESSEEHLPFLDDAIEAWHALVIPYAHRGATGWRGKVEHESAIRVSDADPEGPLVVLTSAGYIDPGPGDEERIYQFMVGIDEVLDFYETLPGNLRRGLYSGAAVDGRDGCTITLWQDDKSMTTAAYKTGVHKKQIDRSKGGALFDYSSFTRGRIVASRGAWSGTDPIKDLTS